MTEYLELIYERKKGTHLEWGHWDLNPDLRVSSGS